MRAHSISHCRSTVVALLTLFVAVAVPPAAAAVSGRPARPPFPIAGATAGWEEVGAGSASGGGISDNDGSSSAPAVAVGPHGVVYVAWHDDSDECGDDDIYARRWEGSSWEELRIGSASGGGISRNDGTSRAPSIAAGPGGDLYVAWHDNSGGERNYEIYVRRWDGNDWGEVGAGSATGGGISDNGGDSTHPTAAVAPDGTPYVAWSDDSHSSGKPEIYVRRWDGNNWVEVGAGSATGGGISDSGGISVFPSLVVASDGRPCVAWSDYVEVYVRCWDGSAWAEVGAGSATGGGISDSGGWSSAPSLAVAPGGPPIVAWEDGYSGSREIYVRRWDGNNWVEVGAGSAPSGGISDSSGDSEFPSLAIAADGTPYVAWQDNTSGERQIYVRRWDGSAWAEVGAGSATGGGISHTSGESRLPAMAMAPDGTCYAAWGDYGNGDREIYARRAPPELVIAPTALAILAEVGGANPGPRHIAVGSIGRAITWTAAVSPAVGWLDVAPVSGTTPATITASVDISGLGVHAYTTQVIVQAREDVLNSRQTVAVRLIVAEEILNVYLPLVLKGT
jgi:hypothetical protein